MVFQGRSGHTGHWRGCSQYTHVYLCCIECVLWKCFLLVNSVLGNIHSSPLYCPCKGWIGRQGNEVLGGSNTNCWHGVVVARNQPLINKNKILLKIRMWSSVALAIMVIKLEVFNLMTTSRRSTLEALGTLLVLLWPLVDLYVGG